MSELVIAEKQVLVDIADAIRSKAGTTESMALSEMAEAVTNLPSGGSGSDGGSGECAPSAENVTFGNVKRVEVTTGPTGKAYYNGVLLPVIPEDALKNYPYAWVRNNTTSGYYDLVLAAYPWYVSDSGIYCSGGESVTEPWYQISIATAEGATEWTFSQNTTGWFGLDDNRTVLWASHDIPNGSADATDIYFEGTEPVIQETEIRTEYLEPVERLGEYTAKGDFLNEVAGYVQKLIGKMALLTPEGILAGLASVKYIPQGYGESVFTLSFGTEAIGALPLVQKGTASSSFTLNFETSATGALQEE